MGYGEFGFDGGGVGGEIGRVVGEAFAERWVREEWC